MPMTFIFPLAPLRSVSFKTIIRIGFTPAIVSQPLKLIIKNLTTKAAFLSKLSYLPLRFQGLYFDVSMTSGLLMSTKLTTPFKTLAALVA